MTLPTPSSALFLSDEEAMARVQRDGDHRAFGLIVCRWEGAILRLCTRMTGDAHRGEDLTQEAFTRLYSQAASYRHGARVSTFLWRLAVNLCLDELRKAKQRIGSIQDEENAGDAPVAALPSPLTATLHAERAEQVREALARLPDHYRAVVVLRHYEGLKFREIAEVLGIPEGTVKSRMAEALERLAKTLRPLAGSGTT